MRAELQPVSGRREPFRMVSRAEGFFASRVAWARERIGAVRDSGRGRAHRSAQLVG